VAETLPGPMIAQSNVLRREEGNSPYLVDNYDLFTTWSNAIHVYFLKGITRLQPGQRPWLGLPGETNRFSDI